MVLLSAAVLKGQQSLGESVANSDITTPAVVLSYEDTAKSAWGGETADFKTGLSGLGVTDGMEY